MRILVLHSMANSFVRYDGYLDHDRHDVTYVTTAGRTESLPQNVRLKVIERDGSLDREESILAVVKDINPAPELVVAFSEFDIITAAKIREMFGLPGLTVAQVFPFRNKVAMKTLVRNADLRAPRFMRLSEALAENRPQPDWSGKTVLKPVAGASSKNTFTYSTPEAALEAVRLGEVAEDPAEFEIEEFLDGPVMHIDGVLIDGEPAVIQASRYVGDCLNYAASGTPLGGVQVETTSEIVDWSRQCLKAVGITDGLFHLESIQTTEGPAFLEVGARCGAVGVVESFERATGIHMPGAALRLLVDGPDSFPVPHIPQADERYGWFVFPGHMLGTPSCRVTGGDAIQKHRLVKRWEQHEPGQPVKNVPSYAYQHIPVGGVVGPSTTDELEGLMKEIFDSVEVTPFLGSDEFSESGTPN